jgi:RHS repeat-associated protein
LADDTNPNFYFMADDFGSLQKVVGSSGLAARYDYDPWGRRVKTTGSGVEGDFGFTGHYFHVPSGLHLALYRAYSAELGRWPSRDPVGEPGFEASRDVLPPLSWSSHRPAELVAGPNLYDYVGNDAIDRVDPLGLDWLDCVSACIKKFDPVPSSAAKCGLIVFGPWPKPPLLGSTPYGSFLRRWFGLKDLGRSWWVKYITIPTAIVYGDYMAGITASCMATCAADSSAY